MTDSPVDPNFRHCISVMEEGLDFKAVLHTEINFFLTSKKVNAMLLGRINEIIFTAFQNEPLFMSSDLIMKAISLELIISDLDLQGHVWLKIHIEH